MYAVGAGVKKDSAEAVKWYRRAAANGQLQAKAALGEHLIWGAGVVKDSKEGRRTLREAAEQGSREAAESFRLDCLLGLSGPKDIEAALDVMRVFANRGDHELQLALGQLLRGNRDLGIKPDLREAEKWLRRAAEAGNATAQHDLGWLNFKGEGIDQNYREAEKWFRKAALQGDASSQQLMGYLHERGLGVSSNYKEAASWYKKAAEQGENLAMTSLAFLYEIGQGVPQDYMEAYRWFNLASADDSESAPKNRARVAELMTPAQIAEAQRLSREFKPPKEGKSSTTGGTSSSTGQDPRGTGTGFFITEDGFLITNEHVIRDAQRVQLVTSSGLIPATLVRVDAANDMALLKAEGSFSFLSLAPSKGMKLGSTVATVGFPNVGLQGFAPKLAKGEIASLSGVRDDPRYFQISVPVQPGNSGGALVNEQGNVIGVVSAKLSARAAISSSGAIPENVNYAVKSGFLLSFLESLPQVSNKLPPPDSRSLNFEEVVSRAEQAAVLVLVY